MDTIPAEVLRTGFTSDDVTIQTYGVDENQVLVVDRFYADPIGVRTLALGLSGWQEVTSFPGVRTHVPADTSLLFQGLLKHIGAVGLAPDNACSEHAIFSMLTRRNGELKPSSAQQPHFDSDQADFAGLVYLNLPSQCHGGTSFFKHRASGLESWPGDLDQVRAALARLGVEASSFASADAAIDALFTRMFQSAPERLSADYLRGSNEQWELLLRVPMRFNRAIFFPSVLLHSVDYSDDMFGDSPATRRLTQTMFLKVVPPSDEATSPA